MKAICEMLRHGASYLDIANQFSISVSRVSKIREYAGIERRHKPRDDSATGSPRPSTDTA
jgi:hypothetical protein